MAVWYTAVSLILSANSAAASPAATLSASMAGYQSQTIVFPLQFGPFYAQTSITLTATASSGLPVTYTVFSGPGVVSGSFLTFTGPGSVVVEADQAGNMAYQAATPVQVTFTDSTLTEAVNSTSVPVTTVVVFTASGTVGTIAALTQGVPNLAFHIVPGGTCAAGTAYTAGQACTVNFTFAPTFPGANFGGITLTTTAGALLANSYIYGIGNGPQGIFSIPSQEPVQIANAYSPSDVKTDAAGNVFVADSYDSQIVEILAAGGHTVKQFLASANGNFNYPGGVALDGSGNIFVADTGNNVIKEILANGGYTTVLTLPLPKDSFRSPTCLAVDANGNVFVSDTSAGTAKEITAASGYTTLRSIGTAITCPAFDEMGNLFTASLELTEVSGYQTSVPTPYPTGSIDGGIAIDGAADIFFVGNILNSSSTHEVVELPASTKYTTGKVIGAALASMIGLARDPSGNIYFTNSQGVWEYPRAAPPTLVFLPTPVGVVSADSPITTILSNEGNEPLVPVQATYNPTITSGFQVDTILNPSSCPENGIALQTGASCDFYVSFVPVIAGSNITGQFTQYDNNLNIANTTQVVPLIGTATGALTAPTIAFSVPNHTFGDAPFRVSATSNSTGSFNYSVVSGPATISGSTVTLTGAGTVTLLASQAAAGTYAAGTQTESFTVAAETPTIAFSIPDHATGDPPFTIAATSNSTGALTYTVLSGPATIVGATVTLTGAGAVVVLATQAASTNFTAGSQQATFTVTVMLVAPTIGFAVPGHTYGDPPFTVAATSNSPGAIAYAVLNGPATIAGSTVTPTGAGVVSLQASQAAAGTYTAGAQTASFTVAKASQAINFSAPPSPVTFGGNAIVLTATASSGLPVSFRIVSGPATLNGNLLTLTGAGTVGLAADQAGDANYNAAAEVTRSIVVYLGSPAVTLALAPAAVFTENPVTFRAQVSSPAATPTGSVVFYDGAAALATIPLAGGAASFTTASLAAGVHAITASYSGDTNFAPAVSPAATEAVEDFTITFTGNTTPVIPHGGSAEFSLLIDPVGGARMPASLSFAVIGGPGQSIVTLSPASLAAGSPATPVSLTIQTPDYPTSDIPFDRWPGATLAFLCFGGLCLGSSKRPTIRLLLWLMVTALIAQGLTGCGSGWPPATYSIQVTASSGALAHTAEATLTTR